MITGGKRMKSLLLSGKVKPDMGGQVLDLYNQSVLQGISPTIKTTIDTSNMTYKGNPIIGTMHDGLWYQQDINGMLEQLMFQKQVTHASFLPSPPDEDRERTSLSHHR